MGEAVHLGSLRESQLRRLTVGEWFLMGERQYLNGILVLCVSYRNHGSTCVYVNDLLQADDPGGLRVVVVDNDPERATVPELLGLQADPRVRVLKPERNLGYFGGAQWALSRSVEDGSFPQWVIVSNTDLRMRQRDFWVRLGDRARECPPGVLAPAIRSSISRHDHNPFMKSRPLRLRMLWYKWVFRTYPTLVAYELAALLLKTAAGVLAGSGIGRVRSVGETSPIYAPYGAFIAFHRSYFEGGGSLDHGLFLYGEEIFVAETARRLGLTVMYEPSLQIEHNPHETIGRKKNRETARHLGRASAVGYDRYFRKQRTG